MTLLYISLYFTVIFVFKGYFEKKQKETLFNENLFADLPCLAETPKGIDYKYRMETICSNMHAELRNMLKGMSDAEKDKNLESILINYIPKNGRARSFLDNVKNN